MTESKLRDDSRFAHVAWDPKFKRMPRREQKVVVDKRFQSMFSDAKFKSKGSVDKRGRKVASSSGEDLRRFYALNDEDDDEDEEGSVASEAGDEGEEAGEEEVKLDLARGEGNVQSSDESEDEGDLGSKSGGEEDGDMEHPWAQLDADAPEAPAITRRLALCNMDWDRIRATDLLVLFNSFKPPSGVVHSVRIYPSEFGREKMKEEEEKGPVDLLKAADQSLPKEETSTKYSLQTELTRQYQLQRLRYYYAVIECDSAETADAVYESCNRSEYESSADLLDLRFIPDDMTFDETPKQEATSVGDLSAFKPSLYIDSALQQTAVQLTWEQTDPERLAAMRDAFNEDNPRLNEFLASGSSSDEESGSQPRLDLQDILTSSSGTVFGKNSENKDLEMEISWEPGLGQLEKKDTEEATSGKSGHTPWEKYLDKRKTKKKERKEEIKRLRQKRKLQRDESPVETDEPGEMPVDSSLDLLLADEDNAGRKNFSLKKLVKGRRKKAEEGAEEGFQVNVEDPRFTALYTSHLYNVDPSDTNYRKTKGSEALVEHKMRLVETRDLPPASAAHASPDTDRLVQSLKSKAKNISRPKTKLSSTKSRRLGPKSADE